MKTDSVMFKIKTNSASLESLYHEAMAIEEKCQDYRLSNLMQNLKFMDNGNLTFLGDELATTKLASVTTVEKEDVPVLPIALSQLCTRIGVPASYASKCLDAGKEKLFARNMNEWLLEQPEDSSALVRMYDGNVRGFLSSRYTSYDSPYVIRNIMDNIDEDEFVIKGHFLNETNFHIRMIKKERMHVDNEDLYAGLSISSSDVGVGSLNVNFFIYKQVCSNGLIVSKIGGRLLRQRHIGIDGKQFELALNEVYTKFDDICKNVESIISKAKSEFWDEKEIENYIMKATKEAKLTKKQQERVLELAKTRYISSNGSVSKWGIINGLTEVAQEMNFDRQIEVETYAGNLLSA